MTAKNLGVDPRAGRPDRRRPRAARDVARRVRDRRRRCCRARGRRRRSREAMGVVGAANKYLSDMEPWKLKNTDPARMASVLHVALQVVDDAKTMLTPFLPSSSSKVHAALGGSGDWARMPDLVEVDEPTAPGSPNYSRAHRRLRHRRALGVDADRGRAARSRRRRRSSPSSTRRSSTRSSPGWPPIRPDRSCTCDVGRPTGQRGACTLVAGLRRAHPSGRDGRRGPGRRPDDAFVAGVMAEAPAVGVVAAVTVGDTVASSRWCVARPRRTTTCTRPSRCTRPRSPGSTTTATRRSSGSPLTSASWRSARPGSTTTGTAPTRRSSRSISAATSRWPSASGSR